MFISSQPKKQTADILTFSTWKEETPVLGIDSRWVVTAYAHKVGHKDVHVLHVLKPELQYKYLRAQVHTEQVGSSFVINLFKQSSFI